MNSIFIDLASYSLIVEGKFGHANFCISLFNVSGFGLPRVGKEADVEI